MTRWSETAPDGHDATAYQARFDALAASGGAVHGEADRCAALVPAGSRVLDAGCGTGRVGGELFARGYDVIGVDVDTGMLSQARARFPEVRWVQADLATLDPSGHALGEPFELVVAAGNVVPLVSPGTEAEVIARLAAVLRPGGLLVAGFGLDAAHLPLDDAPFALADYDRWCTAAGLTLEARHATWEGAPFETGGGYAVSVHRVAGRHARDR